MPYQKLILAVTLCLILAGCAQPQKTWVSTPEMSVFKRPPFAIKVMPQIHNKVGYNVFLLIVENNGPQPIAINWNRSQYLINGKRAGRFVFAGIDPSAVKTATVPLELIQPGDTLEKRFGPFKTIAYAPLKDRKQASDPGLSFGLLPEGENTVILALRMGGKTTRARFSFSIKAQIMEQ